MTLGDYVLGDCKYFLEHGWTRWLYTLFGTSKNRIEHTLWNCFGTL